MGAHHHHHQQQHQYYARRAFSCWAACRSSISSPAVAAAPPRWRLARWCPRTRKGHVAGVGDRSRRFHGRFVRLVLVDSAERSCFSCSWWLCKIGCPTRCDTVIPDNARRLGQVRQLSVLEQDGTRSILNLVILWNTTAFARGYYVTKL